MKSLEIFWNRFGLASDLTEHKRQSTCGGSRQVTQRSMIGKRRKDKNSSFFTSAGNATNVVGVWAAREVLKSTLEFTQGGSSKEIRHNI